jgi:hypothetical protein
MFDYKRVASAGHAEAEQLGQESFWRQAVNTIKLLSVSALGLLPGKQFFRVIGSLPGKQFFRQHGGASLCAAKGTT